MKFVYSLKKTKKSFHHESSFTDFRQTYKFHAVSFVLTHKGNYCALIWKH